jgi:hypothetical protein
MGKWLLVAALAVGAGVAAVVALGGKDVQRYMKMRQM